MHAVSRPKFATGIALAGAAVIALSPVTVPLPDAVERVTAAAPSVQLTAIDNPFPLWEAITQQAVGGLQALVEEYLADPAPILTQIARNQAQSITELAFLGTTYVSSLGTSAWNLPADVLEILADLQAGNVNAAVQQLVATLRAPLDMTAWLAREAFPILVRPIDRLLGLATALPAVISPIVDAIMVAGSTYIMSVAGTADDVWRGIKALDFDRTVNALLTGLAVIPATALGLVAAPLQGWMGASAVIAKVLRDIDPPPGLPTVAPTALPDPEAPSLSIDVPQQDSQPDVTAQRNAVAQQVSVSESIDVVKDADVDVDVDVEEDVEKPVRPKVRNGLAFSPGSTSADVTESDGADDVADEAAATDTGVEPTGAGTAAADTGADKADSDSDD
ncbi:hypothetical protein SAMN04489835_5680 [Mycolicibacterium rutilum]|uniref:PE-PGRS family protein n=1 Tax=Mycolicibacterium rutilum TaxID=370526 RepID=A0A1H6LSX0_MYCRU|nr:hypothetical protein [Mycolicibacterium rutilum]SEH91809.1 hypothetical protein SAMN04489835_5680 [Mycolicibacterium rutilum]